MLFRGSFRLSVGGTVSAGLLRRGRRRPVLGRLAPRRGRLLAASRSGLLRLGRLLRRLLRWLLSLLGLRRRGGLLLPLRLGRTVPTLGSITALSRVAGRLHEHLRTVLPNGEFEVVFFNLNLRHVAFSDEAQQFLNL